MTRRRDAETSTDRHRKVTMSRAEKQTNSKYPQCAGELEKERKGQQQSKETVWPIHM